MQTSNFKCTPIVGRLTGYNVTCYSPIVRKEVTMLLPNLRPTDWPIVGERPDKCIQDTHPHLSPEEREFLVTGLTPAEWDRLTL